jgi:hypothetical protein
MVGFAQAGTKQMGQRIPIGNEERHELHNSLKFVKDDEDEAAFGDRLEDNNLEASRASVVKFSSSPKGDNKDTSESGRRSITFGDDDCDGGENETSLIRSDAQLQHM